VRFIKFTVTTALALLAGCASSPMPPYPGPPAAGGAPAPGVVPAPAQGQAPARSWADYRLRAAGRIVQANGGQTFTGPLPEALQAIPVLQIQLNADGSVRAIDILRRPRFAPETLQMAMDAIRRAAPFGPVSHLPRPWQFNETFLYNDDLKFQLRSLVEGQ
jgi:hypothetical protein